jgi:hypothetical protein
VCHLPEIAQQRHEQKRIKSPYPIVLQSAPMRVTWLAVGLGLFTTFGCKSTPQSQDDDDGVAGDAGTDATTAEGTSGGEGSSSTQDGSAPDSPVKFDFGWIPDTPPGSLGCGASDTPSCDELDDDPLHAMGLNCPGDPEVQGSFSGNPEAILVHEGNVGTYNPPPFPPREGAKVVVLSSGIAEQLFSPGTFPSTLHPGEDPGLALPAPVEPNPVHETTTCTDDPTLIGTGDCSNSIEEQLFPGGTAMQAEVYDWAELRFSATVPANINGFSFDFAMFSVEYPDFYHAVFNDMFIAWLESEQWTGNISFDEAGHPISLNAGFLDYKDAPNPYDCPEPCQAPELEGTALAGHAATKWLTTTAPVTPGETFELVLAVFDVSDNALDTLVLLDNFQWSCDGSAPSTKPAG